MLLQGLSAPRDVRPSIHRCLIYLGDLARYQAQLGQQLASAATRAAAAAANTSNASTSATAASRTEWNRAAQFYKLAARCLPRSGHPHNQLAVMSFFGGDELRAVYYYFRSLSVAMPFLTARENLLLLFEQNRARWVGSKGWGGWGGEVIMIGPF